VGCVGAGGVNLLMGCDLKRLGGAELAYPKVGRKLELVVLNNTLLTLPKLDGTVYVLYAFVVCFVCFCLVV
jgi:hypothetical protein